MRRRVFALCALTLLALSAFAQGQDFSKVEIKVTKVAGDIYLLQGAGGNIAASVDENGIVLVDDEFSPLATKIGAALKGLGITDKPVHFIVNTQYHFDHTGGNVPFAGDGTTIIAQDNVRTRLATGSKSGNGASVRFDSKPVEKAALPVIRFDHDVSVHLNGEDLRALHFPAGHTGGDAIIFFPKANVVHMGDDYVRYGIPFIDVDAGGSVQGMIKACEGVAAMLPPDARVIPGHGELSNIREVREFVKMLKGASAAVEKALHAGRALEQMKKDNVLAAWGPKYSSELIKTDAFIETLYNSLTHREHTPFVNHD
jgi:glyoxylase-like metal-dependent hydrolase (beta-lactamase superfamily II)